MAAMYILAVLKLLRFAIMSDIYHEIFPLYFLATMDKHGIVVVEGYEVDEVSWDWAK